ncbi:MAG: T9SS type A sorting domain-containing protein [Ignavibacteria bacterium]|nr:T9SS type A sorting domain-containing protein [Ignavibacteria bacterium]
MYEAQNINLSSESIYSIDLKGLNSGLYFIQINWKSGTQDYKFLKYYKFLKVN